ncbi:MAG: hypothetical protein K0R29_1378 [Pseudobdellovibrio sp.]|jgi:hypothetical protein|nr:hypothetical protein [Pseudobdellovibrio sp.]
MSIHDILRKLKIPKTVSDYLVPALVAAFLVYQFVVPAVSKTLDVKRGVASVAPSTPAPVKPVVKLKVVPPGNYYSFKANYTCFDVQKGKQVPSVVDLFTVSENQVCQMGDACNTNSPKCRPRLPAESDVAKDAASFTFEKRKYIRQKEAIAESCRVADCSMPPETCKFDELPSLDDNGCPVGCGTITCMPLQANCPHLNCAALPQNCEYDGQAPRDKNGCYTGCGNIKCDSIATMDFIKCPALKCEKLPENCRWDNSGKIDKQGCKTTCGKMVCESIAVKEEDKCPQAPSCAEPPAGCFYVGEPATDKNGCRIGCGGISCKKSVPDKCLPVKCDPLPDNCRYDGNAPLDFNGCMSNCGNMVCK